jgi:hypothetical protein
VSRIDAHGKETDQRLRGSGYPESVSPADDVIAHVYTEAEISNLATSHRMLLDHLTEKEKPPPPKVVSWKWLETNYSENKGMIWLIGLLITAASAAWGLLRH